MKITSLLFSFKLVLFFLLIFPNQPLAQNPKITISEINYKSDKSMDSEDWIELWNYGSSTIDISGWVLQGEKFNEFYQIPQETKIKADKRIVICKDNIKFQQIYPSVDFLGPFVFRLSGKGQTIRLYDGDQILFQELIYRDSLPFPKTPDGHGKTLELVNPEGDLNEGENWFAGCILGSPGSSFKECQNKLVFSEVNHSSSIPLNAGDWVEIRNVSNDPIDVSNWIFKNRKDTNEFIIPANTIIQPDEHLLLARRNKFNDFYPDVLNVLKPFEFGIRSHNEVLKLYDENGKIYISMFYNNQSPWPTKAGTNTITLELLDKDELLCSPLNWFDGCPGGSPGDYYSPACIYSSVNELTTNNAQDNVYPNPFSEFTNIEIKTEYIINENLQLYIYDFTGKSAHQPIVYQKKDLTFDDNGSIKISYKRNNLLPGIYFYKICSKDLILSRGKMIIVN
ncbi:MAG: lamin tail domain-containing protein [Bacteroidota bacterium]|nr:lamin tail domain-containing protein [Bacteroidota bacterium]